MKLKKPKLLILIVFIVLCNIINVEAATVKNKDGKVTQNVCVASSTLPHEMGVVYKITKTKENKNVKLNLIIQRDVDRGNEPKTGCFCPNNDESACLDNGKCSIKNKFSYENNNELCEIIDRDDRNQRYTYSLCDSNEITRNAARQFRYHLQMKESNNGYTLETKLSSEDPADNKILNDKDFKIGNLVMEICISNAKDAEECDNWLEGNMNYTGAVTIKTFTSDAKNNRFYMDDTIGPGQHFVVKISDRSTASAAKCSYPYLQKYKSVTSDMIKNSFNKCDEYKKYIEDNKVPKDLQLIPECNETKLNYKVYDDLQNNFDYRFDTIKKIMNFKASTSNNTYVSDSFTCQYDPEKNDKTEVPIATYKELLSKSEHATGIGTYWDAMCTEELYLKYDHPKTVRAGQGFEYNATVEIKRTCEPVQLKQPVLKPTCKYSVECVGGPHGKKNAVSAGPNEDFDQCIQECDDGKYTQSCINSCYDKVYPTINSTNITSSKMSSNVKNARIEKIASNSECTSIIGTTKNSGCSLNKHTLLPVSSECIFNGNQEGQVQNANGSACLNEKIECKNQTCTTEHKVSFLYANSCNGTGESDDATKCYEVFLNAVKASDCASDESETNRIFYNEVIAANSEYIRLNELMKTVQGKNSEYYSMTIDEQYKSTKQTQTSILFDNNIQNQENMILSSEEYSETHRNISKDTRITTSTGYDFSEFLTNEQNNDVKKIIEEDKSIDEYTIIRTINLGIGTSYINKYRKNGYISFSKDVFYQQNGVLDTYNNNPEYYGPYHQYFTSYSTKLGVNNWDYPYIFEPWDRGVDKKTTAKTVSYTTALPNRKVYTSNIHVDLNKIGTWNQWGDVKDANNNVKVNCMYRTVPNTYICLGNDCPEEGVQFIFRPINLFDMFPDRNPRYNWTDNASISAQNNVLKYKVAPKELITKTQSKGNSVYTDTAEYDYEFILTKQNIRNIRKYNKSVRDYNGDGEKNYLDYNMICSNSGGKEICTSRFLDNFDGNSGTDSFADSQFVTYPSGFTTANRKAIAGCNNSKSFQCDD